MLLVHMTTSSRQATSMTTLENPDTMPTKPVKGDPCSSSSKFFSTFLAYWPSGTVTGEVVYANYGQETDFDRLKDMGINITGSIVIARLGKSFRGDIVLNAQAENAAAAILFSDPLDDGANGTQGYYPGFQPVVSNDIFCVPGWPSNRGAEQLDVSDPDVVLPKIPALPISAEDALSIFVAVAPSDRQGGLAVDEYRVAMLHLSYLVNDTVTGIRDVIGVIIRERRKTDMLFLDIIEMHGLSGQSIRTVARPVSSRFRS